MFKLILFNKISISLFCMTCIIGFLFPSSWTYKADLLTASTIDNIEIKELTGNVVIQKASTSLITNKALIYSNGVKFELFADIQMIDNENILTCDTLYYFSSDIENILISIKHNIAVISDANQVGQAGVL